MARPKKSRRICSVPRVCVFEPVQQEEHVRLSAQKQLLDRLKLSKHLKEVRMTVDEYECIRLMDYMGFSQQECAKRMNVARTTVTLIYESARKKMAQCLVEGAALVIDGGNYTVCDRNAECRGICGEKKKENPEENPEENQEGAEGLN